MQISQGIAQCLSLSLSVMETKSFIEEDRGGGGEKVEQRLGTLNMEGVVGCKAH